MLKHRVQHPPPVTHSAPAGTPNLAVPPEPSNPPRSETPTQQAQPLSGTPTHVQSRPETPTNVQPRPETPTHIQPRSDTPTHVQTRSEVPPHVQPRSETQTHVRSYTDSPKHVKMLHPEASGLAQQGRSDSFSMQSRSETLNNKRSGSFSAHVPQSRSEYSITTSNHTGFAEGMSMSSSYDAKEGVKRITEKYDSIGNLTGSPCRTSVGSPGLDGLQFNFADIISSQKYREGMAEQDLLQIETFYKSHKSDVFVCGCLANMYFGSMKSTISSDQWTFSSTGIPLLLLDTGEHRRERKLYLILAEKGTGFTLWRDVIDKMTGYRTPNANFHTMRTSADHSRVAGFSFDDAAAAAEFYNHIDRLTADPNDELLTQTKIKKKKSIKDKLRKIKLPKKSEISQPCCFVHVTKLDKPFVDMCGDQQQQQQQQQPQQQQTEQQQDSQVEGSGLISQPFNFHHVTGKPVTDNDVTTGDISNMVDSKLTIDSNDSFDSGLPEKS